MVDRKLYCRSRQKVFLNRVVDEELYWPDAPHRRRGVDRRLSEPRNRLVEFMEPSPRFVPEARPARRPEPQEREAVDSPGFLVRLWRRLGSLLPGIWS